MSSSTNAIVLGVVALILGVVALAFPAATSLTVTIFVGWAFLVIGALQAFAAFRGRSYGDMIWGIVSVVLGVMLIAQPLDGMVALTVAVGVLFFVSGLFRVVAGFRMRHGVRWIVIGSGALSLLLGLFVLLGVPASAAVTLGILLAVELIFVGSGLLAIGIARR